MAGGWERDWIQLAMVPPNAKGGNYCGHWRVTGHNIYRGTGGERRNEGRRKGSSERARLHGKGRRRLKGQRAEEWKLGACISLRLSDNSFLFHTHGRFWLAFLSKLTRGHAMPGLRPPPFPAGILSNGFDKRLQLPFLPRHCTAIYSTTVEEIES